MGLRGVLICLVSLAAACGAPTSEAPPQDISEIVIGVPESKAQAEATGIAEFARFLSVEGLVKVGSDGNAKPWLASEWSWENDDRRLRIRLRPNVLFHDGTPLTAEFAAQVLQGGASNPGNRGLFPALNDVESVTHEGDLDVVVQLTRTSPEVLIDLGMPLRTGKDGSIGTGPYRLDKVGTDEIVMKRFDQYYLGKPTSAQLRIKPFDTLRTAWTSLLRGELDLVTDVPADAVEFVRNDDVRVISYNRRYQFMIPFNASRGALRSPAVRRALNLAIDRETLIKQALQGAGTASSGPIWPEYWAYDAGVQSPAFDPVQAMTLLDTAGYPVRPPAGGIGPPARFRFTCLLPQGFSVYERLALEVQKYLLNVGVDMQLLAVTPREYNKLILSGDFDAILNDMSSGPTPGRAYVFWRSRKSFEGPFNVFGYENAEAERLFTVTSTSMNAAAVRSATSRLQQVLLDDPPALFIAWNTRARAVRREFIIPGDAELIGSLWRWTVAPGTRRAAPSTQSAP